MRLVTPAVLWVGVLCLSAGPRAARAQEQPTGPTVPIADAKHRPGVTRVTLAERSPFSADVAALAKRTGQSAKPPVPTRGKPVVPPPPADYVLSAHTFYVRVPASPGDGGRYGVMVAQSFAGHGFPPPAWAAVLDAHHLTWMAADDGGEGKPVTEQIGLLLDAAHNATGTWRVDPERVYLAMCRNQGPYMGTALYYPDVFAGQIQAVSPGWYAKLKGFDRPPMIWDSDLFPPPQAKDMAVAKAHSRI